MKESRTSEREEGERDGNLKQRELDSGPTGPSPHSSPLRRDHPDACNHPIQSPSPIHPPP